jgi:hypothetical protein
MWRGELKNWYAAHANILMYLQHKYFIYNLIPCTAKTKIYKYVKNIKISVYLNRGRRGKRLNFFQDKIKFCKTQFHNPIQLTHTKRKKNKTTTQNVIIMHHTDYEKKWNKKKSSMEFLLIKNLIYIYLSSNKNWNKLKHNNTHTEREKSQNETFI